MDRQLRRGALQQPRRLPFHRRLREPRIRCVGRSFPRRSPSPSRPRSWRSAGRTSSRRRSPNASRAGRLRWTHGRDRRQSGRPDGGPEQGLAGRPPQGRGRNADRADDHPRGGRAMPRHQLRSDRAAERDLDLGRPVPGRALLGLPRLVRPARRPRRRTIREPRREGTHDQRSPASRRSSARCTGSWRSAS